MKVYWIDLGIRLCVNRKGYRCSIEIFYMSFCLLIFSLQETKGGSSEQQCGAQTGIVRYCNWCSSYLGHHSEFRGRRGQRGVLSGLVPAVCALLLGAPANMAYGRSVVRILSARQAQLKFILGCIEQERLPVVHQLHGLVLCRHMKVGRCE